MQHKVELTKQGAYEDLYNRLDTKEGEVQMTKDRNGSV